ncbi:MAG: IS4 family transposase [Deltaproteobacteria bacterium]|nr:MAG: IS4 family transposase [Deltaproteobacteria bacterium]
MNEAIIALTSTTFAGKRFTRNQLVQIQQTVNDCNHLSLRELGYTLCEHLNWVTPGGKYRIQTCLNALEEMQTAGLFLLPEKQARPKKTTQKPIQWSNRTAPDSAIDGLLEQFTAITVEPITEKDAKVRFNEYIDRYHYLGYQRPIGNHLRYFIIGQDDQGERLLGCLLFAFAVNRLACRDQWLGWSDKQCEKHLPLVINNTRFLIFPWVQVKNLASKALSLAANRVADDWLTHHGLHPVLMETFVDTGHFTGTSYKAANWLCIGQSNGQKGSKNTVERNPKAVFVYPLHEEYRTILTQNRLWLKPTRKRTKQSARNGAAEPSVLTGNDPFVGLWQRVIGLVSTVADEFDAQWRQRRRVINTLLLILFIFRLVFSKNQQGYGTTIVELWAQCQQMGVPLPQPKPVAASAFCNARKKLDAAIFKTLNSRIIATYEPLPESYHWLGRRLFAVDGMKINLPRPLRHADYAMPSDKSHYPQGLVSCLYQLKSQIPYDFELASHMDERRMAQAHLKTLRSGDVVVYDRGYFSYVMLYAHQRAGVDVIFRLSRRAGKGIEVFMDSSETEKTVTIEMPPVRQKTILEKHPDMEFQPLSLRLIKYVFDGTTYTLGTTLLDGNLYQKAAFPDLYHARWGIEELYKVSKKLVGVDDFHAQTERGVKQELFAHFVLLTLNRILANHTEAGLNADRKPQAVAPRFQVNIKNSLVTMARHLEELFLRQTQLTCDTLNSMINAIGFCRQKTRPGRKHPRVSMKPVGKWQSSNA